MKMKDVKIKRWSYLLLGIFLIPWILSVSFYDKIDEWEKPGMKTLEVGYMIFVTIIWFFIPAMAMSDHKVTISLFSVVISLIFSVFALDHGYLIGSWLCLFFSSLVLTVIAILDQQYQINKKIKGVI